jgi:hypothetical protein
MSERKNKQFEDVLIDFQGKINGTFANPFCTKFSFFWKTVFCHFWKGKTELSSTTSSSSSFPQRSSTHLSSSAIYNEILPKRKKGESIFFSFEL